MQITRRKSKTIKIGNVYIGGNHPISIQSMVKTKTANVDDTLSQIKDLEDSGCEIIRLAVKDNADAKALKRIKNAAGIPVVADIHFDWHLALAAIDSGIDKIRLNPGNIYKKEQIREIVSAAKSNSVPIRVGVNSGSLKRTTQNAQRRTIADIMVKSALGYIKILEGFKFYDIVVSLKASDIFDTIGAYRKMAKLCDYPFHLGVTATGSTSLGSIKSSIVLGVLLLEGLGDTIRVSLTDKPQEEVRVAKFILQALGLRRFCPEIISCPTCGRCEVDLVTIVKNLETKLSTIDHRLSTIDYRLLTRPIKVAIMGCVVNGPGEAREADIGIAFGRKDGLLFKKGKPVKKVSAQQCEDFLLDEISKFGNKVNGAQS